MGQPVLFLFMAKWKDSWWELSEEERTEIGAKVGESQKAVGSKFLVSANCEWSSPQYQSFGVQEFPSIEALQKHYADQREAGFLKHLEVFTVVGTPWEPESGND